MLICFYIVRHDGATGVVSSASAADDAEKSMLTVTIKPSNKQVRANVPFEVKLEVANSSVTTQTIRVQGETIGILN